MPGLCFEQYRGAVKKMARVRPYPPRGARRRDRQRILAAAVSFMLLGAQFFAALHFVFVPHTIDARTSEVVRCSDTHDHQSGREPNRYPDDSTPERDAPAPQECQVLAFLQQAQIQTAPPSTMLSSPIVETIVLPPRNRVPHCRFRLYLVSPAHSPPAPALC